MSVPLPSRNNAMPVTTVIGCEPAEPSAPCRGFWKSASRHLVPPGTRMAGSDLAEACTEAAISGLAHVAAVRRELLMAGVVTPDEVDGPDASIAFNVRRQPHRLRLVVRESDDHPRLASITESAAEALRRFDQVTTVIDVVNEPF